MTTLHDMAREAWATVKAEEEARERAKAADQERRDNERYKEGVVVLCEMAGRVLRVHAVPADCLKEPSGATAPRFTPVLRWEGLKFVEWGGSLILVADCRDCGRRQHMGGIVSLADLGALLEMMPEAGPQCESCETVERMRQARTTESEDAEAERQSEEQHADTMAALEAKDRHEADPAVSFFTALCALIDERIAIGAGE